MTPKEKAEELLKTMSEKTYSYQPYAGAHYNVEEIGYEAGLKCAKVCVQEIFDTVLDIYETVDERKYWDEVKQELEKL